MSISIMSNFFFMAVRKLEPNFFRLCTIKCNDAYMIHYVFVIILLVKDEQIDINGLYSMTIKLS